MAHRVYRALMTAQAWFAARGDVESAMLLGEVLRRLGRELYPVKEAS